MGSITRAVNDRRHWRRHRRPPAANGALSLQCRNPRAAIELKVGQSVDIVLGTIEEPYARQLPRPNRAQAGQRCCRQAGARQKATATARTPEQKMLEAKPESALERLRPTRPRKRQCAGSPLTNH